MQLRQLAYFVEIIQCRSMSQAARKLYISQPSLSQTIQNLEEELGFPLLVRTSQGVRPTEMGKRVYRDARKIVEESARMVDAWKAEYRLSQTVEGTVRVVTVPTAYPMVAEHSVPVIESAYPKIRCLVMEARRFEILSYLSQHKADLGIANVVSHEREDFMASAREQGVRVIPLLEDTFQIAISSKNPLARQKQVSPEDLKRVSLVLYSGQDAIGTPYYAKYFNPADTLYVNSSEKMVRMVANNQAVAVFPMRITCYCQDDALREQIRFLEVEGICLPITHYLAWRESEKLDQAVQKVKDVICDTYRSVSDES
ncbi:MAG: LysR family transcriptional regulator [Oscillospiraceae bacterium]